MSVWFSISGTLSAILSSIVLVPDCLQSIQTREVSMSKSYLILKSLVLVNNIQYSVAIGIAYGWYASLYVGLSTAISACCLTVLWHVKNQEPIYCELP